MVTANRDNRFVGGTVSFSETRKRQPDIVSLRRDRKLKPGRHYAHDGVAAAVQNNVLTRDIRIAIQVCTPQLVADNRDVMSGLVFLWAKIASQNRLNAQ